MRLTTGTSTNCTSTTGTTARYANTNNMMTSINNKLIKRNYMKKVTGQLKVAVKAKPKSRDIPKGKFDFKAMIAKKMANKK